MRDLKAWFFFFMIGTLLGIALGSWSEAYKYKHQAIRRGFAEYNQTTGDWQWKETGDG